MRSLPFIAGICVILLSGYATALFTLLSDSKPESPFWTSSSRILRFPCSRHNEFATGAGRSKISEVPTARFRPSHERRLLRRNRLLRLALNPNHPRFGRFAKPSWREPGHFANLGFVTVTSEFSAQLTARVRRRREKDQVKTRVRSYICLVLLCLFITDIAVSDSQAWLMTQPWGQALTKKLSSYDGSRGRLSVSLAFRSFTISR